MVKGTREANVHKINYLWKENGEYRNLFPHQWAYNDEVSECTQMWK